ncbi:MAG: surface-adhesin E family protein [Trinickia sp.]|uniref:surface-adhesin E family protein n=1 Tax=Trinickia sp. TaxID=2571163 RepID=UPI003F7E72B0
MKLLRRLLVCLMPMGAMVHAEATQWSYLSGERDLSYAVDTDSVATDADGYIEYIGKTTWKVPEKVQGAAQPVAISLTRYQIDCGHKRWRAVDTHYLAADGTPAGFVHPTSPEWTAIGPGTVVDIMFRKVC